MSFIQFSKMNHIPNSCRDGSRKRVSIQKPTKYFKNLSIHCSVNNNILLSNSIHTFAKVYLNSQLLKEVIHWGSFWVEIYKIFQSKEWVKISKYFTLSSFFSFHFHSYKYSRFIRLPIVEGMGPLREFPDKSLQKKLNTNDLQCKNIFLIFLFEIEFLQLFKRD